PSELAGPQRGDAGAGWQPGCVQYKFSQRRYLHLFIYGHQRLYQLGDDPADSQPPATDSDAGGLPVDELFGPVSADGLSG
ncbi:hypothetical protein, partial [Spirosoma profusum]|uniref:hypothetical protein n=1 Tax=Spirosoma profusum TaxID=2771354 RepID=UPI001CC2557A